MEKSDSKSGRAEPTAGTAKPAQDWLGISADFARVRESLPNDRRGRRAVEAGGKRTPGTAVRSVSRACAEVPIRLPAKTRNGN